MAVCSKRRSISSMSTRSTPNCTSQIGHPAKRRYFLYFLFSLRAVTRCTREGREQNGLRRESSKNHASRDARMWKPGPSVIGSRYFHSTMRALEGHNPRAWLNSTLIRQTHTSWSGRVSKLTSYKQDTRWILRKYWLAAEFRGICLELLCTRDKYARIRLFRIVWNLRNRAHPEMRRTATQKYKNLSVDAQLLKIRV